MKKVSILTLLTLWPSLASAHFTWLEHSCEKDSSCRVKLYFGEYHQQLREPLSGRLSERKETKLFLENGRRARSPLTFEKKKDHFEAAFERAKEHSYSVTAIDDESPVVDLSASRIGVVRPIYYARTAIPQSSPANTDAELPSPSLALDVLPSRSAAQVGEPTSFRIFYKGKPLSERAKVRVYAPNGWSWEGDVKRGAVEFVPEWPGLYIAEALVLEESPGEFKGKAYEAIRHRATLSLYAGG